MALGQPNFLHSAAEHTIHFIFLKIRPNKEDDFTNHGLPCTSFPIPTLLNARDFYLMEIKFFSNNGYFLSIKNRFIFGFRTHAKTININSHFLPY